MAGSNKVGDATAVNVSKMPVYLGRIPLMRGTRRLGYTSSLMSSMMDDIRQDVLQVVISVICPLTVSTQE